MKKIKLFLIFLFVSSMLTAQMAERERFAGVWVLETAEYREASLNNLKQETKNVYTLENIGKVPFYDAITEMRFVEIEAAAIEKNTKTADTKTLDFDYIKTITKQYQNPVVRVLGEHIEFSARNAKEGTPVNQYEYIFINPEKLLLISNDIFYPKDEEPMRARLFMALSRKSN